MAKKINWAGKAKIERERKAAQAGLQKGKTGRLTKRSGMLFRYVCRCGNVYRALSPGTCGECS